MRLYRLIGPLVALTACTDLSTPSAPSPPPPPYRLTTADVWSGAPVRLISRAPLPDTLPTVIVGGVAVAVVRLDDTTMLLDAPVAVGDVPVRVVANDGSDAVGTLNVHGFDQIGTLFGLWGLLTQLPAAPASVIGNGTTGLARVDLLTGTVTPLPDSMHSSNCDWGPGVTPEPGRFILEAPNGGCSNASWQIAPFLERFASTPTFPPVGGPAHRVIAELGPGRWLVSEANDFTLWACDSACVNTSGDVPPDVPGQLDGVHLSPRGDRAAVDDHPVAGATGVPVLNTATGTVAYREPSMAWSEGAAFSSGGDTLFIAGGDSASGGQCWMYVLQASDGVVLDSVPLAVRPGDLALDPGGRWIYVSGAYASYHVSYWVVASGLEVVDRATLRPVSIMRSDSLPAAMTGAYASKHRLVLDPTDHTGYVLRTDLYVVPDSVYWPWTATTHLFGFSTPP